MQLSKRKLLLLPNLCHDGLFKCLCVFLLYSLFKKKKKRDLSCEQKMLLFSLCSREYNKSVHRLDGCHDVSALPSAVSSAPRKFTPFPQSRIT